MSASHDFALSVERRECKVHWEQLCSNEEIWEWFENKKMPRSLHGNLTRPSVYRFLLPNEDLSRPSRCYIGEAERLQTRIREHLTLRKIRTPDIWRSCQENKILGALQNLNYLKCPLRELKNDVSLEELIIEGGYLLGVPVNHFSLDSSFGRKVFENIEILRAENVNGFELLNSGISVSSKDFQRICKASSVKLV